MKVTINVNTSLNKLDIVIEKIVKIKEKHLNDIHEVNIEVHGEESQDFLISTPINPFDEMTQLISLECK